MSGEALRLSGLESVPPSSDVAAVLSENHRRCLAFLSRRVPTLEIAEDILQEAFVRGLTTALALAMERYAAEVDDAVAPLDAELFDVLCGCVRSLVTTLKPDYATAVTVSPHA